LDRVLYEDADLIVIDKPVNVSTHAPDAGRTDDALTRLRMALAERDRVPLEAVYLGIHQRLDRDTSGVLLFTRRKSANPGVAAEFEGRRVEKTYVAGVVEWPKKLEKGILSHVLVAGEGGRMEVATAKAKRGQEAITRFRVLRRSGARTLLELSPQTGRTHQLRVQVAATGARMAGDRLYGLEPAHRLMLHATRLAFRHPSSKDRLEVRSPVPREFEDWLARSDVRAIEDDEIFETRLRDAVASRWGLGHSVDTTAFRLLNGEGDGIDGVAVDLYGEHLVVHFFSEEAVARREPIVDRTSLLGTRGIYVKIHPKQANTLVDPRVESLAPSAPVWGEPASDPLMVHEAGLAFRVRLGDGLKTGLFLDQRENRRRIRELAREKRVLNLFAYTCGFTVAAAAGGARATVSIDASKGVLAWGRENLEENGLSGSQHAFIDDDVLVWLKLAAKRNERFELIVLDPPSYATTKISRFSAEDDLPDLAARALAVLAPGGRMLACTNHRGIATRKFRKQLHEAGRQARRAILQMKDLPCPLDFPAPLGADPHLKSVLLTVE